MCKIQSVNYQHQPKLAQKNANHAATQSFGSLPNDTLVKEIAYSFKKNMMTKPITFFDYLNLKDGELQSQFINALFTATLAPTMIAFNPFCDKPKQQKEYLALRQFVSVAIALMGTAPLTLLVNKQIAKIGSEGDISSIDIRMAPHRDYLHKEFKNEFKKTKVSDAAKQRFEQEVGLTDQRILALSNAKGLTSMKRRYYEANLEQCFVDKKQTEARNFFANLINRNVFDSEGNVKTSVEKSTGDVLILDENNKPVIKFCKGGEDRIKILNEAGEVIKLDKNNKITNSVEKVAGNYELKRDIPKISTIEDLTSYIQKHSIHNRKFGDFMKDNFNFEFYYNVEIKPDSTLKKLSDVNIKDFLSAIGLDKSLKADDIRKVIGKAYQGKLLKELDGDKEMHSFAEAISKMISRTIQNETGEQGSQKINASLNQFMERTDFLEQFGGSKGGAAREVKLEQLQKLMDTPIAKVMEKLKETFIKNGVAFNEPEEKGLEGITERYVKKFTTRLTENFKNTSKFYSLTAAVGITMITCTILNWLYPRLIAKFFPQLLPLKEPSEVKEGGKK